MRDLCDSKRFMKKVSPEVLNIFDWNGILSEN